MGLQGGDEGGGQLAGVLFEGLASCMAAVTARSPWAACLGGLENRCEGRGGVGRHLAQGFTQGRRRARSAWIMGEFYGGEPPSRGDAMMCEQLRTLFGSFRLVKSARTWKVQTWQQWVSMGDLDIDLNGGLIGKYRIIQKLGEGATSEVYLCRDDFHDRHVAMKRVRSSALSDAVDGPVYRALFCRRSRPGGPPAAPECGAHLDAVPDPTSPYVVMEYVPGTTLRAFCRPDQLLPLELIVEIGFKCAMALGYVYRQGLIHRDVKPANILALVNDAGAVTDVKISDFGSVLNLTAESTQIHQVGSLAYMAPEQLDGEVPDCRADIYGLGAVLYHLIAGRPPFEASSQAVLMNQIYNQMPTALSGQRSGVNSAVDEVVLKALAKDPKDRYPNWDAFAQALSGLIADHQVPRGHLQGVLDSERFNLLRSLDFFTQFGDVELWEVVHRAKWQRFPFGHALYRRGEEGRTSTSWRRAASRCTATTSAWPCWAPAPRWARWPTWRPAPTCVATAPMWW